MRMAHDVRFEKAAKYLIQTTYIVYRFLLIFVFFFSVAGYDAAITIKELNENDLVDLENFGKTIPDLISTYCSDKKITLDADHTNKFHQLFLGLYGSNSR